MQFVLRMPGLRASRVPYPESARPAIKPYVLGAILEFSGLIAQVCDKNKEPPRG